MTKYTKGTKNELLDRLESSTGINSSAREQIKIAIQVRCVEDVEKSIDNLRQSIVQVSKSNSKLSKKILILNIIITVATITGIVIAILEYYNKLPQ